MATTGDIQYVGNQVYLQTNDGGTLEKLGYLGFFRQLWIAVKDRTTGWSPEELRRYCRKHHR